MNVFTAGGRRGMTIVSGGMTRGLPDHPTDVRQTTAAGTTHVRTETRGAMLAINTTRGDQTAAKTAARNATTVAITPTGAVSLV